MRHRDTRTASLFDWEPPQVTVGYAKDVAGHGALENKIARLLARALRDAKDGEDKLSRAEIAGLMTLELHREISPAMLDKWASEASGAHRIPLDAFIALIKVTGAEELLGFIPELMGFAVVPKQYTEIIELHLIEQKQQELAAASDALKARLRSRK